MTLERLPYRGIDDVLGTYLGDEEDPATVALVEGLAPAQARGYLRRSELEEICRWKSPRAIHRIRSNSHGAVRARTRAALASRSERVRIEQLTRLAGVSVPMASAVLTLLDPRRYGVIDIRVWQLLHALGAVTTNGSGRGLRAGNWHEFLGILRHFARRHRVTARDVERALFAAHRDHQRGTLYGSTGAAASQARPGARGRRKPHRSVDSGSARTSSGMTEGIA